MTTIGPFKGWEAFSEKGKPWCLIPASAVEGGLSLTLYPSKTGKLKGVVVIDRATGETLAVVGKVPKSERPA